MANEIKVEVVSGVFGLLGGLCTHLPKVEGVLFQWNIGARMHQVSEAAPSDDLCNDNSDLGRLVLHSRGDDRGIFFCAQGRGPDYDNPVWFVADGISVAEYMR